MKYEVIFSRQAMKDLSLLRGARLLEKARALLDILAENPFQNPPPYEKLVGNMSGLYSRRINRQHRLVYQILAEEHKVHVLRAWSHYQ